METEFTFSTGHFRIFCVKSSDGEVTEMDEACQKLLDGMIFTGEISYPGPHRGKVEEITNPFLFAHSSDVVSRLIEMDLTEEKNSELKKQFSRWFDIECYIFAGAQIGNRFANSSRGNPITRIVFQAKAFTIFSVGKSSGEVLELNLGDMLLFEGKSFSGKKSYEGKWQDKVSQIANPELFVETGDMIQSGGFDLDKLPAKKRKTAALLAKAMPNIVECYIFARR